MSTFIDQLVSLLYNEYKGDYRNVSVIFPTRRACLIFRMRLAAAHSKPVWAPGIMSIGDFVEKHVSHPVADEITLLVSLYPVYKKYWPDWEFGKYYPWGKILLNDFDEADKQLHDPAQLFKTTAELKKIDATFFPDPESFNWVQDFLSGFSEKELTYIQEQFAANWNQLHSIYKDFNKELDRQKISYEGKAYRELLRMIRRSEFTDNTKHFLFAGFYGFSRVEEEIITELKKSHRTEVFWDADPYYVNNRQHEAGWYFRKSKLIAGDFKWNTPHIENHSRTVTLAAVPLMAAQAKYAGSVLREMLTVGNADIHSTAIVMPDEQMLPQMLYALPPEADPVNVTMGFPLEQSHFSGLFNLLKDLQEFVQVKEGRPFAFRESEVRQLLRSPLLSGVVRSHPPHTGKRYLLPDDITGIYGLKSPEPLFVFTCNATEIFRYVDEVLSWLCHTDTKDQQTSAFDISVLEFIRSELNILEKSLATVITDVDSITSWQMIIECVSGLRIPFSGEPVHGLQVMGFLETRALDFETLIIINMNEGILPMQSKNTSFIPYSLRKAFGLSTYEDREATFAYHFYRLLHRSKNIHLVYNSEVSKTGGGEPSRYLLQLKLELKKHLGDKLNLREITVTAPLPEVTSLPPVIEKDEEVINILNKYHSTDDPIKISSTALTTYISCSLKFYYRYIARIKEPDQTGLRMEPYEFGNILHKVMEKVYAGEEEIITGEHISKQLQRIPAFMEEAIDEEYRFPFQQLQGSDIIMAGVIRELARRIMEHDLADAPFRILDLEGTFEVPFEAAGKKFILLGKFDRLDEKDGVIRIIDYKTGKVKLKVKSIEDIFRKPENQTLFQIYLYSSIYQKLNPGKEFKSGFYAARELGGGILFPDKKIDAHLISEFDEMLKGLLKEIFSPDRPFTATDDLKQCLYCPYRDLCNR
jgi:CRISPR/Cas system-associated exonuclease Cas4 (RecB family)